MPTRQDVGGPGTAVADVLGMKRRAWVLMLALLTGTGCARPSSSDGSCAGATLERVYGDPGRCVGDGWYEVGTSDGSDNGTSTTPPNGSGGDNTPGGSGNDGTDDTSGSAGTDSGDDSGDDAGDDSGDDEGDDGDDVTDDVRHAHHKGEHRQAHSETIKVADDTPELSSPTRRAPATRATSRASCSPRPRAARTRARRSVRAP